MFHIVALIRSSTTLSDDELYQVLVARGIEPQRAARIVEFLPTAYSRFILQDSGARFSEMFQRKLPSGGFSDECPLSLEPVWNEAIEFVRYEISCGICASDLIAVAARSPEFHAANELLNQGSKLKDIAFTAIGLLWPESGPEKG